MMTVLSISYFELATYNLEFEYNYKCVNYEGDYSNEQMNDDQDIQNLFLAIMSSNE